MYYRHNFLGFFLFLGGGGGQGNMAIYFKGTLENNSLFLGNITNVWKCLKIILKNKADHKKSLFAVSLPTHLYSLYPTHFMALLGNNYSFLALLLSKNQRKKMHAKIFTSLPTNPKIQGRGIANT